MKQTFCLVLLVFTNFLSYCQAPDYDDLKILYADGKYEKLVAAADKYTLKEREIVMKRLENKIVFSIMSFILSGKAIV